MTADDDATIAAARARFADQRAHAPTMARTTVRERRARLARLHDAIVRHREDLALAMRADFGRPEIETEVMDVRPTLGEIAHARRHLRRWMRPRRLRAPVTLGSPRAQLRYEARGVVLVLAPWNYAVQLSLVPLVSALAAGCCVMLRPSEKTPRTGEVLQAIVADGCEPHEATVVLGDVPVAEALLELPFDHFFFTGGEAVGRRVMTAAARHLATVTLELGGKSPAVVLPDADLALAARRIAWGKCINAGQTCVAPDFALVPRARQLDFAAAVAAAIREFYGETPAAQAASPDLARLIDARAWQRLTTLLDDTLARGARLVAGGEREADGRYLAPAVVTDVPWDAPLMQEELFGPVLPIVPYDDLGAALEELRRRPAPLALYAFGGRRTAERVLRTVPSGAAVVNDVVLHVGAPTLPFGGRGASGQGSYHGWHGFRTFSHERAVVWQRRRSVAALLYPPYDARVRRLAGAMRRWLG